MPGGKPLGTAGSTEAIREVPGGMSEGQRMFDRLSAGGRDVTPPTYRGTMVELPDGSRIGFRPVSKYGPPTIDVFIDGVPIEKVKFK